MYIDRVVIENVRGFRGKAVDLQLGRPAGGRSKKREYAGWTVIAGRNGSGKTTLLRAIALAIAGPVAARQLCESFVGWVHGEKSAAKSGVTLKTGVDDGTSVNEKFYAQTLDVALEWTAVEEKEPRMQPALDGNIKKERDPRDGPWSEYSSGWMMAGYGPLRRLTGHAVGAQRIMSSRHRLANLATLFREDAALMEALEWLREFHLKSLEAKKENTYHRNMKEFVFALLNDGLLPDHEMRVVDFDSNGLWVKRGAAKPCLLSDLSDGYRTVVALVLDMLRSISLDETLMPYIWAAAERLGVLEIKNKSKTKVATDRKARIDVGGVVLIDEIDAHLHVSWQRRIGPWLTAHFPNIQFIVTTHSPFVCQTASPNGLVLLPELGSDQPARIADDALYQRATNGPVDDALLSDLFGLEYTWSDESQRKRQRLGALEIKLGRNKATPEEREEYEQLRGEIPVSLSSEVAAALKGLPRRGAERNS